MLRRRGEILASIRAFFAPRDVLEVETPLLAAAGVTDPQIDGIPATVPGLGRRWLQTSPEYAMKRLLAAGCGSIYQLGRAFRAGELGRFHNPEFTLLEWYRPGLDAGALMDEVAALVAEVLGPAPVERLEYREAFRRHAGLDPFTASLAELQQAASAAGPVQGLDRDRVLDLLMGVEVAPRLGRGVRTFITGYPASQAALARLRPDDPATAERFELFVEGLELANGFRELTDPHEQARRFREDRRRRRAAGRPAPAADRRLLAALEAGLPDCSGVALGVDRLVMLACGADHIQEVLAFPADRA